MVAINEPRPIASASFGDRTRLATAVKESGDD
jgi:hypothetical protein